MWIIQLSAEKLFTSEKLKTKRTREMGVASKGAYILETPVHLLCGERKE